MPGTTQAAMETFWAASVAIGDGMKAVIARFNLPEQEAFEVFSEAFSKSLHEQK